VAVALAVQARPDLELNPENPKVAPQQDRFQQLRAEKKHFLDTSKFIAYRAETALAQLAREKRHRLEDARSLIRQVFRAEVDLMPDHQNKTLTARLRPLTTEVHDEVVKTFAIMLMTRRRVAARL